MSVMAIAPFGDEYHAAKNVGVNYLTVGQTFS